MVDKNGRRYLVFDNPSKPGRQKPELVYQSVISLNESDEARAVYADYFNLALVFFPTLQKVCMIGLGGGAVPRQFLHDYPQLSFTTIEIDRVVVEVAYRFFKLPRDSRHRIIVEDGRHFLEQAEEQYDLILLDAFFARSVPQRLYTVEFFQIILERLNTAGLLAINFNGAVTGKKSGPFRTVYRTLKEVFPEVYLFAVRGDADDAMQNLILFALRERQQLTEEEIRLKAMELTRSTVRIPHYVNLAEHCYRQQIEQDGVEPLTDQNTPPEGELNLY